MPDNDAVDLVKHDDDCIKRKVARSAYYTRWPRACRRCNGRGALWDSGDPEVGIGAGYIEPCACQETDGKCPRCATVYDIDTVCEEAWACPACEWRYEGPDYCTDEDYCDCNLIELDLDDIALEEVFDA